MPVLGSRPDIKLAIILALLLAGLSLIHFIVLAFALCFMTVSGIAWAAGARRELIWPRLARAAAGAGLALALSGPWLWLLASRALLPSGAGQAQELLGRGAFYALDTRLLWASHNRLLIALALAAALWGIRRRVGLVAVQLVWVAALCVLANPWLALYLLPAGGAVLLACGLARRRALPMLAGCALLLFNPLLVGKLPYLAVINTEAVVISLFLPVGVLLGGGAVLLWERVEDKEARRQGERSCCDLLVSVSPCLLRGRVMEQTGPSGIYCWIEHIGAVGRVGSA